MGRSGRSGEGEVAINKGYECNVNADELSQRRMLEFRLLVSKIRKGVFMPTCK